MDLVVEGRERCVGSLVVGLCWANGGGGNTVNRLERWRAWRGGGGFLSLGFFLLSLMLCHKREGWFLLLKETGIK